MGFPERLQYYRKLMSLSQEELAVKMNVNQRTISSWENGRTEPNFGEAFELCKIFDCTLADLTDTRERRVGEITIEDIYERIRTMKPIELQELEKKVQQELRYHAEIEGLIREKQALEAEMLKMQKKISVLEMETKKFRKV